MRVGIKIIGYCKMSKRTFLLLTLTHSLTDRERKELVHKQTDGKNRKKIKTETGYPISYHADVFQLLRESGQPASYYYYLLARIRDGGVTTRPKS